MSTRAISRAGPGRDRGCSSMAGISVPRTVRTAAIAWDRNFDGLAANYHVVAPDKLGQGHTGNPINDDYTINAVVHHRRGLHRYRRSVQRPSGRAFAGRLPGHAADARIPGTRSLLHHRRLRHPRPPASGSTRSFMPSRPTRPLSRECQRWTYEKYSYSPRPHHRRLAQCRGRSRPASQDAGKRSGRWRDEGLKGGPSSCPELARQKAETLRWIQDRKMKRPTQGGVGVTTTPTAPLRQGIPLYEMIAAGERQAYFHIINRAGALSVPRASGTFQRDRPRVHLPA